MAAREGDTALTAGTWPLGGLGDTRDTRVGHSTERGIYGTGGMHGTQRGDRWHLAGGHSPEEDMAPTGDTELRGHAWRRGTYTWQWGGHGTLETQRWHPEGGHNPHGGHTALGGPRWWQGPSSRPQDAVPPPPLHRCLGGFPGRPQPPGRGADVRRDPPISRCSHPVPAIDVLDAPGDPLVSTPGESWWGSAPRDPPWGAPWGGGVHPSCRRGGPTVTPEGGGGRGVAGPGVWGGGAVGVQGVAGVSGGAGPPVPAGETLRRFEVGLSPQLTQRRETAPGAGSAVPSCGGRAGRGQPGGAGRDRGTARGGKAEVGTPGGHGVGFDHPISEGSAPGCSPAPRAVGQDRPVRHE